MLEPTNTPSDLVIWIPLEGIYRMEGHLLPDGTDGKDIGAVEIPDELKEVSAVMVKFHSPGVGMLLAPEINRGDEATFAWPIADVMLSFLGKLAWITDILRYVAYLVVVVAGFGLLASVYNTMNERRREFAVLRALGAAKRTVFSAIVLEAATIAFLGSPPSTRPSSSARRSSSSRQASFSRSTPTPRSSDPVMVLVAVAGLPRPQGLFHRRRAHTGLSPLPGQPLDATLHLLVMPIIRTAPPAGRRRSRARRLPLHRHGRGGP